MIFAILAGAFGALASFTSKEATSAGLTLESLTAERIGTILAFLGCNLAMVLCFKRALGTSSSAATALALNMASNFICTAMISRFRYHEALRQTWWIGAFCIGLGTVLLETGKEEAKEKKS